MNPMSLRDRAVVCLCVLVVAMCVVWLLRVAR